MKKKILIIIPGSPYPPINGHKLKIFNLIKILALNFDLHIITLSRSKLSAEECGFINEHAYKSCHIKLRLVSSIFSSLYKFLFCFKPLQVGFFETTTLKKYLKYECADIDYVFFNLIRTTGFINYFHDKIKVFDMVDLISDSYIKSYKNTSSLIHKIFYKLEIARLKRYEKYVVSKSNLTIAVNEDETISMQPYGNIKWIPNGVNSILFSYNNVSDEYANSIAFIGAMHYQPNIDAILWMDKFILDNLDTRIKLFVIGPNPSNQVLNIAVKRKNVIVTGFLDDPYLIINSCTAVVSPMQNGGGIQNKVLESMALGKVNILSSLCAKPIRGGDDMVHFMIEDDPLLMVQKINDVCLNPISYSKIGSSAKKLVKDFYTWEAYEKKLLSELEKL